MRKFMTALRDFVSVAMLIILLIGGGFFALGSVASAEKPVCPYTGYKLEFRMCVDNKGNMKHPVFVAIKPAAR